MAKETKAQKAEREAAGTGTEITPAAGDAATGDGSGQALPPADGDDDDHITAFDRQLERLVGIVMDSEFESGSIRGDIRDTMLDVIKSRPKPWSQLSELEQRDLVRALDVVTTAIVKKIVFVLAEQDDLSVHATLKGYSADGGTFKLKLVAQGDSDTAQQLYALDGHEVVLISADSKRYQGARKDPKIDPDQPGLEFADQEIRSEPPKPNAPASTETDDLNPGGAAIDSLKATRVNLVEGTIEETVDGKTYSFVRDATPEELGAARDAQADFQDDDE